MMTRKRLLIPLSLILITLLPLICCSAKDDESKTETIEYSLLNNITNLTLSEPTFSEMEELKHYTRLEVLKVQQLREDYEDNEYNGTLNFVSYLPSLTKLEVDASSKSLDISALSGSKLNSLILHVPSGSIASLEPLGELVVYDLNIHAAGTLSLEPLAKCSSLENFSLYCDSADITPIAALPSLRKLVLGNGVDDISGLAANRSLKQLFLVSSSKGLEALGDVPLSYIAANQCASFKLEQLEGLSTIETIAISDEYISDITALSSMDNIKSIYLSTAGDNGIGSGVVISSEDAPELDLLITSIPVNQLREFLSKEGTSITIYGEPNR